MPRDSKILGETLMSPTKSAKMTTLPITASLAFLASSLGSTCYGFCTFSAKQHYEITNTWGGPGPPRRIILHSLEQQRNPKFGRFLDFDTIYHLSLKWQNMNFMNECVQTVGHMKNLVHTASKIVASLFAALTSQPCAFQRPIYKQHYCIHFHSLPSPLWFFPSFFLSAICLWSRK